MKSSKEKRALIAGMIGCLLLDHGTESAGHLLVLALGLVLLREMEKSGESCGCGYRKEV